MVTVSAAAKAIGISPPTIRISLEHLMQLGLVREITGNRSRRAFLYEPFWQILEQDTESVA